MNLQEIHEPQEAGDGVWQTEIRSRVKEMRACKVSMIPANEIWKDLLKKDAQEN